MPEECTICNKKADEIFKRVETWSNDNWRLTMSTYKAIRGFCYLEPIRHIPYITDLEGKEVFEFGPVLASAAKALSFATKAELVYIYIYGGHTPHLHVHLAPHKEGDFYVDDVIIKKGNIALSKIRAIKDKCPGDENGILAGKHLESLEIQLEFEEPLPGADNSRKRHASLPRRRN